MLNRIFCLALISVLGLLPASQSQSATPVATVQSLLSKPKLLCGRFEQSKQLTGMKKPFVSSGRFCVIAGKGVLWRNLQPFPSTLRLTRDEIVQFQGERVAMRLDAKQEPVVRMINSVLFSLLSGDLSQLETLFETDANIDGNNWKVHLKAREAALAKALGTITLEGSNYVKTIHLNEASGDRTTIVFSEIKTGDSAITAEEAALF